MAKNDLLANRLRNETAHSPSLGAACARSIFAPLHGGCIPRSVCARHVVVVVVVWRRAGRVVGGAVGRRDVVGRRAQSAADDPEARHGELQELRRRQGGRPLPPLLFQRRRAQRQVRNRRRCRAARPRAPNTRALLRHRARRGFSALCGGGAAPRALARGARAAPRAVHFTPPSPLTSRLTTPTPRSGKSNVIDAMLFVFGKRAAQMRLKKVSELIHRSAEYPACESARVSVYFQEIFDDPVDADAYTVLPGSQVRRRRGGGWQPTRRPRHARPLPTPVPAPPWPVRRAVCRHAHGAAVQRVLVLHQRRAVVVCRGHGAAARPGH
jgi:hypothetical protein